MSPRASSTYNLEIEYPEIARRWHPTKNGYLKPSQITPGSHRKVWWRCTQGHEWTASIGNRTGNSKKRGSKCPECQGRKVGKENNLVVTFPELAKQWHPTKNGDLTPYDFTSGSNKKIWWSCDRGHEWLTSIGTRTTGRGCPHCSPQSSRLEIRVYTELKSIFREVNHRKKIDQIECDVFLPEYKIGIEIDGYRWHDGYEERDSAKNHQLKEIGIDLYRIRGRPLSSITNNDVFFRKGENHLPILKKTLKSLSENPRFSTDERKKMLYYIKSNKLQNNDEYKVILSSFPSPLPEKSLESLFPELVFEWNYEKNNPLKPNMFSPGTPKKVWWRCEKGHEWNTAIMSRSKGHGCPYCAGKYPLSDYNLETEYPETAKEWHPTKNGDLKPSDMTPRSGKKVWWMCERGHEWIQTVHNRTRGSGCPECYKKGLKNQ